MEALALGSIARELPYQVGDILEQMRDGTFQMHFENPGLDELDDHIDQASNRLVGGPDRARRTARLVDHRGVRAGWAAHRSGLHLLSFVGFLLSGAFGLWLIWGVLRHGRL